jgi:exopolysaccharide biosynthesis predicted pyruvyltransferase EpsI
MFKSIKTALSRKQEDLNTQSSVAVLVRQAVRTYLQENYPAVSIPVEVRYQPEERLLTLSTTSKTFAGELTLTTREIRSYLTVHNIRVNRIVVR